MKSLILTLLISCTAFAQDTKYHVETFVSKNDVIWGFDFLKDKRVLFSERSGKLFIFDPATKKTTEVTGVPEVYAVGQGGLLDVRVHPSNGYIYLSYAEPVGKKESTTAVGRAKLEGTKLVGFKKLFSARPVSKNDYHYGSRIDFDGKGHMFISVGERGERGSVQQLSTHVGKIVRLKEDGSVPQDNPYIGAKDAKPENWAYGLRNPQGMMMKPGTNQLWEVEMGPKGGDEINLIEAKNNYGWPIVTYGTEYHGPKIGEGTSKPGMVEPVIYWVPSISPSAMTFYTGDKMKEWKGNIFLALLSGQHLRRLEMNDKKVSKQEELFKNLDWRWRNVRTGPDGYLWFSTDEGKLGRIVNK
jgi:aldose sugar dehydrogenase